MGIISSRCKIRGFLPPLAAQKHAKRAVPAGTKGFLSYFLCLTKSTESRGAAKGFKFVCAKFWFCALNRGLQNLEALFGKVLILLVRSRYCGELNRGLRNLDSPCEGVRFYSFRLYKKNGEYPKGLRPSGLPGTIQSSARYEIFAEMTGVHQVTGRTGYCNLSGYRR